MKIFLDFLPIVMFFGAYKMYGIMVATAVAMVASVGLTAWGWWRTGRVSPMHLSGAVIILVFGGATLVLQDERFIKLKPSVLYLVLAVAFVASHLTQKTLAERMFAGVGEGVPRTVLRRVNVAWALFFVVLAGLNLYVASEFETATWVNFKLFGLLGLTLVFAVAQAFYVAAFSRESGSDTVPAVEPPEGGDGR